MEIETVPNAGPGPEAQTEAPKTEATTAGVAEKATGSEEAQRSEQTGAGDRHKIKYGKNERELTVDELKILAQKGWAADDRFQQAARLKKELEEAVKQAKWDKLIEKQTGKPAIEYYKEQLKAEIRRRNMTPEEAALEEQRQKVEALKAEENEILTRRQEQQIAEQEAKITAQWDKEMADAIESEGLPKTKYALQRAVAIAKKVVDMGLDPDWKLVMREAKTQMLGDWKEMWASHKDDNKLLDLLGDEFAMRVSKALVNRKQPAPAQKRAVESQHGDNFRQKEVKNVDVDQWLANRRKKFEEG